MNIESYRQYCLSKPAVTEDLPFGPDVLVMRVSGKIFALFDIVRFESVNLKCEPEKATALREEHRGIIPGYHMNKKHWNTVMTDGSISDMLLCELTDHSYDLVFSSLPKAIREKLAVRK